MPAFKHYNALILGLLLCAGLTALGAILGFSALRHKEYERSVLVKGLSEREYAADIVIWPIEFTVADNDLTRLYDSLEVRTAAVVDFLGAAGLTAEELSFSAPAVTDSFASQFRNSENAAYRFSGMRSVTVYSNKVAAVRSAMARLSELGKRDLVLSGGNWHSMTQYLFTQLNEIKPSMVEEATRNARAVATKFAADSSSSLGRIKHASQGQFTISDRDANNPHIKSIRVVSTIEYYLAD